MTNRNEWETEAELAAERAKAAQAKAEARSAELKATVREYLARLNFQQQGILQRRRLRRWAERNPGQRPWDAERCQPSEREVRIVAARWRSSDGRFKLAVADNRWNLDQAAAYGAAATGTNNERKEDEA